MQKGGLMGAQVAGLGRRARARLPAPRRQTPAHFLAQALLHRPILSRHEGQEHGGARDRAAQPRAIALHSRARSHRTSRPDGSGAGRAHPLSRGLTREGLRESLEKVSFADVPPGARLIVWTELVEDSVGVHHDLPLISITVEPGDVAEQVEEALAAKLDPINDDDRFVFLTLLACDSQRADAQFTDQAALLLNLFEGHSVSALPLLRIARGYTPFPDRVQAYKPPQPEAHLSDVFELLWTN
jgi:hypothetical protein